MALCFCKSFVSFLRLRDLQHLHKPQFSCSLSLVFYSSSGPPEKIPAFSVSTADYLIREHQFSQEAALKASSVVRFLKRPEQSDSILAFLKESGFSQAYLEKTVRRIPRVLSAKLDKTIKPKLEILQDLGCTPTDIAYIISQDPWILNRSTVKSLVPSIVALRSIMGSNSDVYKTLKICARFLKHDLEKTMIPNIEFMKSRGISSSQIRKSMGSFPRFWLQKPERIRDSARRVEELGYDNKSKMYLHAMRHLSSMTLENWELKLKLLRRMGFSQDEVLAAFRKVPQVFGLSERKIKEGARFLLTVGNSDMGYLVSHPELLTFSIEKRLKPRFQILEFLERKNLLPKRPSLATICKISNKQFTGKYVLPYLNEVGDIFCG